MKPAPPVIATLRNDRAIVDSDATRFRPAAPQNRELRSCEVGSVVLAPDREAPSPCTKTPTSRNSCPQRGRSQRFASAITPHRPEPESAWRSQVLDPNFNGVTDPRKGVISHSALGKHVVHFLNQGSGHVRDRAQHSTSGPDLSSHIVDQPSKYNDSVGAECLFERSRSALLEIEFPDCVPGGEGFDNLCTRRQSLPPTTRERPVSAQSLKSPRSPLPVSHSRVRIKPGQAHFGQSVAKKRRTTQDSTRGASGDLPSFGRVAPPWLHRPGGQVTPM
jgi:hypothetical protein